MVSPFGRRLRTMANYSSPEEEWHDFLSGTHPHLQDKSPLRFIPSNPRCKLCKAPFGAPGAMILRRYGFAPWDKNPKICGRCFKGLEIHAKACPCLLYTSDAADDLLCVDLGGRRIIKK